jgi:hypothetical protein
MDIANGNAERMENDRTYKDGKTIFETSHLSIYAVVYEPADTAPAGGGGGNGCDAGFGAAAGLFFAAALACLAARKR